LVDVKYRNVIIVTCLNQTFFVQVGRCKAP
jgi:hypothetical protein